MKKRKMSKKAVRKIAAALLVFVILAGVCIYTVFVRPNLNKETVIYMETQVLRGDIVQGIMENGSITMGEKQVLYDLDMNYKEDEDDEEEEEETSRYLEIEEVYVAQGQRIQEGDALFRFSQDSMDGVRRKLQSAKSEAQVELAEANNEYDSQMLAAKSTYSASKALADTASRTYDTTITRIMHEINLLYGDIQVLEAEINDCNLKLTDEDTLESYSELKFSLELAEKKMDETDRSSVAAYTANYAEYKNAKDAFEQINTQLETYRETIEKNQKDILDKVEKIADMQQSLEQSQLEAQQSYDSSVLGGNLASDIYDYTSSSLKESVDTATETVEDAQKLLDEFDAFVGTEGIIYASESGLVTSISYSAGDKLINTGAMLSYVTSDAYTITIDVSEEDIAYIHVGDSVDIEVNAYPDVVYEGIVSAVTASADSDYSTTVNYPVTISVRGDTSGLYGGMTADITFVTDSISDVLYVSSSAVNEDESGNTFVYVKDESGEMTEKSVITGFSNGSEIEIIEGLEEGETIYIAGTVSAGKDIESLMREETSESSGATGMEGLEDNEMQGDFPEGGEMPDGFSGGEMPDGFPGGGGMPDGFPQ